VLKESIVKLKNHRRRVLPVQIELLEQRLQFTALPTGFVESEIAGDLGKPTAIDVLPDGRVLVAVQTGELRVVANNGLTPAPALQLDVDFDGERGLIGMTHDPNFASNHFIYLYHTVKPSEGSSTHNQITRYTLGDDDLVQADSAVEILRLNDLTGATNHNGGAMHFGTDGLLYVGTGDNARPDNSQTIGNLLGKILRLDVSQIVAGDPVNDVAKLVSPDNPFFNKGATGINQLIYALGLRNPFSFGVQPTTGDILVNDVGLDTWEEINPLIVGRNYGWGKVEGFAATPPAVGPGGYQDPVMAYNHGNTTPTTEATGAAIIGGVFYNPSSNAINPFPTQYVGQYFFGDLGSNFIRTFDPANPGNGADPDTSTLFASDTSPLPTSFSLAPDGGLYYAAIGNGGKLMKISYTANTAINAGGDAAGVYSGDGQFTGGGAAIRRVPIDTSHVVNPAPQSVYQTYRYGTDFTYTLDNLQAGGLYNLLLDFSENKATRAGQRVFDVTANDQSLLSNYDIFADAGGAFIATQKSFQIAADSSGQIVLHFTGIVSNARVNGIRLAPVPVGQSSASASGGQTLTPVLPPVFNLPRTGTVEIQ